MTISKFLKPPFAVTCHDAGAANLIIGWLKKMPKIDFRAHIDGPALSLWQAAFPDSRIFSLNESLQGAVQLISGTGWASLHEHQARVKARELGIPIVAVVDHWVNYRERFIRDGEIILPDEIWVSDEEARIEAYRCFPDLTLREFKNEYLLDQVEKIRALDAQRYASSGEKVLYALEPIRQTWTGEDTRSGEFQALDYFLSQLSVLGLSSRAHIRLRPHPSDAPGKYRDWVDNRKKDYEIELAPEEPLTAAVSWADYVVGCESFVLIIGLAAGKKTISSLPPWGHACRLPQAQLIHLSRLS
jgi:hypothetical protein